MAYIRIGDGVNILRLLDLTNSKPIPTAIVDDSGNQITNFGGGGSAITGFATETTLAAIKTLLQGDVAFSESVWTDDSGVFYIRRVEFNEETNSYSYSFTLPNGTAYVPSTNPRPASTVSDFEVREERFIATANGTGYSTSDVIGLVVFYNVTASPPTISATVWYNLTTNTTIAAPTIGNLREVNKGRATEAKQDALIALLPAALSNGFLQVSIKEAIATNQKAAPYTYTDRSSTSSATPSAWTVVAVANANRQQLTIENPSTTATLTISVGATGSEVVIAGGTIPPGSATAGNNILQLGTTQQINIRSTTASVPFTATEGLYS